MKESLTFYLPLQRNATTPPEVTLIVRRAAEDRWLAGLAVCSKQDQFQKIRGRGLAGSRMRREQFTGDSALQLMHRIDEHLDRLNENRPYTLSVATIQDLYQLVGRLHQMQITQ